MEWVSGGCMRVGWCVMYVGVCGRGNRERRYLIFKMILMLTMLWYIHIYVYVYMCIFFKGLYGHWLVTPPRPELQILWWSITCAMLGIHPPLGVEGGMHIHRERHQSAEGQRLMSLFPEQLGSTSTMPRPLGHDPGTGVGWLFLVKTACSQKLYLHDPATRA